MARDSNLALLGTQLYTKRYNEVFIPQQQKHIDDLEATTEKMQSVSELINRLNSHMHNGNWIATSSEDKLLIDRVRSFDGVFLGDQGAYKWDSLDGLKQEADNLRSWTQTEGQKTTQIYARITEDRKVDNNCFEAIKNMLERDSSEKRTMISNQRA